MSNLLKSKLLVGVTIATMLLSGVAALNATTALAANCSITTTLRVGSKGAEVVCLQNALDNGLVGDGSFGPKTKAKVVAWQASVGLVADGVFGPKSRTAWMSTMGMTYPAGCTSASGVSTTTGQPCTGTVVTGNLPLGCDFAQPTQMFSRTIVNTPCVYNNGTPPLPPAGGTGPLVVSLATDNPAAGNLIQGQATADLAHFQFSGTGTLTQVTLQRSGISDNSVFPNVYLYQGNTRLTDSASINSNGQINFNGLNIAVNGSLNLSVRADVTASTSTSQSTVMVTLTSYMVSGGTSANAVNVAGNLMIINSGTGVLSTVSVGNNTVSSQSISAGTQQLALWSAPITVNLHKVWLKSAAFDVIGSAPSNALANLGLFANGVKVASSTGVNAMNYIVFDLGSTPYSMMTGATTLEVRGDVVNGSSRNVILSLQHSSDLMVTDSQVGVNVSVTGLSGATFSINQGGTITILQGSLVSQSDAAFNSTTNVTGGATNVAIASFKLTSYGEDVKVNTVTVTPTITGSPTACSSGRTSLTGLQNVTLYYNGAPVGSSQPAVTSANSCTFTALTFTPGSNLTIAGGTSGIFQVHADLVNGDGANYSSGSVGATVNITQYQGISSGQTAATGTLSGSNSMNIQTGSLTVASNAAYLSQTINPNTSAAHIGSFTLQNQSTSEGVDINSLTVGLYANSTLTTPLTNSTTVPLTNFSTLTLSGFPGAVTPIGQPTASNVFSTNFTIAAGGSVVVDVWANLGGTNTSTFYTSLTPTAVGHNSRVTITTAAVAGQGITLGVGTIANPTLIANGSTNAQYISTGGTGAPNAAQESYNFVASTGTASIIGLKFAALTGTSTTPTATTVSQFTTSGNGSSIAVADSTGFTVGDNVLVTTTGVFGGTNAIGTVVSKADGTHMLLNLTTVMVAGTTDVAGVTPGVASTIYRLATSGVTSVALNSPGVATTPTPSPSFNGGIAYMSTIMGANGATGAFVPNNPSGITLPVFMSFGPVNTNGGVTSGSTGQILLMYVQYQTGSTTSYLAPSVSGTQLTLVGSKPVMTVASASNTLTNGTNVLIGTLTVSADNTGDIALAEVPLSIAINAGTSGTAGVVANSLTLTDTGGTAITTVTTTQSTISSSSGTSTVVFGSAQANHYRITAGQSKIFEIRANLSTSTFGPSASVSVNLGTKTSFAWDDINGNNIAAAATNGASITAGTGTGSPLLGSLLYAYPTGSATIHN